MSAITCFRNIQKSPKKNYNVFDLYLIKNKKKKYFMHT